MLPGGDTKATATPPTKQAKDTSSHFNTGSHPTAFAITVAHYDTTGHTIPHSKALLTYLHEHCPGTHLLRTQTWTPDLSPSTTISHHVITSAPSQDLLRSLLPSMTADLKLAEQHHCKQLRY